jgi:hypothetical protein
LNMFVQCHVPAMQLKSTPTYPAPLDQCSQKHQDGGPTVKVETAVLGFFSCRFRKSGALPFLSY